jgi:HK97 family phage portal protein
VSLFRRDHAGATPAELIPPRQGVRSGTVAVTNDSAMRHSAVWACLRLRADLVSTMPVDNYRKVGGTQVEVPKPKILVTPGGDRVGINEWMYSTQVDLDRAGNAFGLITERDGNKLPSRIDLCALSDVTVRVRNGAVVKYKIGQTEYDPEAVWHEKQFTIAGLPLGLSPVAYAAWSIGEYQSVQQFALDWFGNGPVPSAVLRNTQLELDETQASEIKDRFRTSIKNGDPFVTGMDWDYSMVEVGSSQTNWIEAKQYGVGDIARFFGCPGDLIDAAVAKSSITYANITQRNLQFLIMHLGPAVVRREAALSTLTLMPRYVKLNTNALLRMDPQTRASTIAAQITARTLAPSEARALDDRPPLTPAQIAEFETLFGPPGASAVPEIPLPTPAPAPEEN